MSTDLKPYRQDPTKLTTGFVKLLSFLAIVVVTIWIGQLQLRAQGCNCDTSIELKTLNICIDSNTYNVTVYGCSAVRYDIPLLDPTCTPTYQQNQYTVIRRVCFNGARPVPIDPVKTFSAILCTMKPVVGDSSWNTGITPPVIGSIWCWTVFTPKCATINQATGCILTCNTLCCRYEMRWVQMASGPSTDIKDGGYEKECSDTSEDCGQAPCVLVGCPNRSNCCIR
jgi:hypothetical protein